MAPGHHQTQVSPVPNHQLPLTAPSWGLRCQWLWVSPSTPSSKWTDNQEAHLSAALPGHPAPFACKSPWLSCIHDHSLHGIVCNQNQQSKNTSYRKHCWFTLETFPTYFFGAAVLAVCFLSLSFLSGWTEGLFARWWQGKHIFQFAKGNKKSLPIPTPPLPGPLTYAWNIWLEVLCLFKHYLLSITIHGKVPAKHSVEFSILPCVADSALHYTRYLDLHCNLMWKMVRHLPVIHPFVPTTAQRPTPGNFPRLQPAAPAGALIVG